MLDRVVCIRLTSGKEKCGRSRLTCFISRNLLRRPEFVISKCGGKYSGWKDCILRFIKLLTALIVSSRFAGLI